MSRSDHSRSQEEIHKGFFQTSLRTFYNILHVKHEERGFLFFSMGRGREDMWSHFLMTGETDCKSHTARHRCRKYLGDAKER